MSLSIRADWTRWAHYDSTCSRVEPLVLRIREKKTSQCRRFVNSVGTHASKCGVMVKCLCCCAGSGLVLISSVCVEDLHTYLGSYRLDRQLPRATLSALLKCHLNLILLPTNLAYESFKYRGRVIYPPLNREVGIARGFPNVCGVMTLACLAGDKQK